VPYCYAKPKTNTPCEPYSPKPPKIWNYRDEATVTCKDRSRGGENERARDYKQM
jgi:hypothetical protein